MNPPLFFMAGAKSAETRPPGPLPSHIFIIVKTKSNELQNQMRFFTSQIIQNEKLHKFSTSNKNTVRKIP